MAVAVSKLFFSTTLSATTSARTRLERRFDPEAIRALKAAVDRDMGIAGPGLAAHAFAAGLVDEVHFLIAPIAIGGGKPALPRGQRIALELVDERRFRCGTVYVRYRVAR